MIIEKTAEQAGFRSGWFSESGDDCETELKEFAKLIIQECANVCFNKYKSSDLFSYNVGIAFAEDIRNHFELE